MSSECCLVIEEKQTNENQKNRKQFDDRAVTSVASSKEKLKLFYCEK